MSDDARRIIESIRDDRRKLSQLLQTEAAKENAEVEYISALSRFDFLPYSVRVWLDFGRQLVSRNADFWLSQIGEELAEADRGDTYALTVQLLEYAAIGDPGSVERLTEHLLTLSEMGVHLPVVSVHQHLCELSEADEGMPFTPRISYAKLAALIGGEEFDDVKKRSAENIRKDPEWQHRGEKRIKQTKHIDLAIQHRILAAFRSKYGTRHV